MWFGHSFHSWQCPLPLPAGEFHHRFGDAGPTPCSKPQRCSKRSRSPSSSSSYPSRWTDRGQGHARKPPCLQMGSPWLCKPCSSGIPEWPFPLGHLARNQGKRFALNVTTGGGKKKAHSRFKIALAAGDVSIGRVAKSSTNDSKHFVKWSSQMMSELSLL